MQKAMQKAIFGRKLGMTQIFDEKGLMIPVTVIQAGPLTVLRKKTAERDGYQALVCAFEDVSDKKLTKPAAGVFKKAKVPAKKVVKELKLPVDSYEVGGTIDCEIFQNGDFVDVSGTSKGHGFTGAIKRWNHHRLKETHGTGPCVRERGSSGMRSDPSRVRKGLHMEGHWGHEKVTVQNLKVVRVDKDRNVLLVMGGIPGPKGGLVTVCQTVK